jgi:hypothetical protein
MPNSAVSDLLVIEGLSLLLSLLVPHALQHRLILVYTVCGFVYYALLMRPAQ